MKPQYRTLEIPGGRAPVCFTHQGARHPLVCLRSLLRALGLAWDTWWPLCMQVYDAHGWPALPARDAQGRLTRLLGARQVPGFLAALAPQVAQTYPAGGNRLAMAAAQLLVTHFESSAAGTLSPALKPPQDTPSDLPQVSTPSEAPKAPSAPISPVFKKPAVAITREVGSEVLALAARGQSRAAIARSLGISKAAATLLANGNYRFAAAQAERPRLADAAPMLHIRTGAPVKVTADTGRQVLALRAQGYAQAEVARRLNVSKATVNLIVHGKYQFAQGT